MLLCSWILGKISKNTPRLYSLRNMNSKWKCFREHFLIFEVHVHHDCAELRIFWTQICALEIVLTTLQAFNLKLHNFQVGLEHIEIVRFTGERPGPLLRWKLPKWNWHTSRNRLLLVKKVWARELKMGYSCRAQDCECFHGCVEYQRSL